MKMPFGKHKGVDLEDVPEDYLIWVLDKCDNAGPTLRAAIRQVLGLEPQDEYARPPPTASWGEPSRPDVGRVKRAVLEAVKRWHRTHAMRNHPDRGGSVQVAQAINSAMDELTRDIEAAFAAST